MKKILLLVILALTIQTIKATVTATGHLTNEADNCSTGLQATFTDKVANGTCEGSKIITRTWSLVDACGKAAATQTQTITVTDNTALVFDKLPEPTTIAHNATPLFQQATFTDACNKVTLTFNDISTTPNCDGSYSITRTWTANDGCNTSITSQIINVLPLVLVANNDSGLSINGSVGGLDNILDNDTFDGELITNPNLVSITYTSNNPGIKLNGASIVVAPGTPAGNYTLVYTICSKSATCSCDSATVTVTVIAQIDAQDDTITDVDGTIGNPNAGNVLGNDTLNGSNVAIGQVNLIIITPATSIGGAPVPSINTTTGKVSVPPGTAGGTYTIVYRICDVINPTNCDDATVTIDVSFTPNPTAEAQTFCGSANVSSIVATGTDLKWYATELGGTALTSDVALASKTYYVSQTLNTIESQRISVAITITPITTTGSYTGSINSGSSYTWPANGVTYTTAQTVVTVVIGCNTATLNLSINPLTNTQETIFNENFGDGGPGAQAALRTITTYYAGTATDTFQSAYPIVYSGEAVIGTLYTATVENYNLAGNQVTGANLTTSNYLNSTGTGFAVMTNRTNEFKIENINTSNRANITLSFGLRVGKNQNSYTNYLKLEQSIDGVTWTPISFLAPPPNQWAYITCTTKLLSNEFLKLRFTQEISIYDTQGWGTTSIDDIKVTGISSSLNIGNNNIGSFKIYPNPVSNVITIDCGNINNIANQPYSITDALGKIVLKGKLNDGETAINVEHLSKGIYCIKIANNKASKFIKE